MSANSSLTLEISISSPFAELLNHRELLALWVRREITARYKQTLLGILWAVVNPLATLAIFAFVFHVIGKTSTRGVPYAVSSYPLVIVWYLFASAITGAVTSISGNMTLIDRVYFPREILPLGAIAVAFVDFLVSGIVAAAVWLYYGMPFYSEAVWLVPLLILLLVFAAGIAFWLSALTVFFRDVRHVIPILMQIWLYASPVGYALSNVPARYVRLYSLNPMVGIMESIRSVLIVGEQPVLTRLVPMIVAGPVLLISGYFFFKRAEAAFSDAQ